MVSFFLAFLTLVSCTATAGLTQEPDPAPDTVAPASAAEPDPEGEAQEPEADPEEEEDDGEPKLDEGLLSAFAFRSVGPALMSGRISDLAIDPVAPNTWYVAAGSGNLWKTENAGTTFTPIFDDQSSYSIGCVTIDPSDHHTLWVGTGEAVGGRHVGFGDGVYRSQDGGGSFTKRGLEATEHISKIVVDPRDSRIVYVAAQGPLWSGGGERGLYKTTDGGGHWEQILAAGEYTGVTDVVIDPRDPQVLYAATHQRLRTVWALMNGGPESGIHKSTDGGATWEELANGLPGADMGKISLALSPQDADVVYATIELGERSGGFWVSSDAGASWEKRSDYISGGTGPHYYQEVWADPHHAGTIYQANVRLGRSEDGGATWSSVSKDTKHVDNHAVAFHPQDPDFLLVGCDGGLYVSYDRGATYRFFETLPLTQFYKLDLDNDWPVYNIVGGTQDNNTQYGPSRTLNRQGIRNSDWRIILGGDGHDNAIDPTNPDIIYGESQQGYIRRFDRRSGESIDIRPQPGPGEDYFRFNWDSPILISPHDPSRIYFGSNFLHRSDDRGDSWTTISDDLSHQRDRLTLPMMDRVWGLDAVWDVYAMSMYGNITSISESPLVEGLLYVGTDDGRLHVSEDGGDSWRSVDGIGDLPSSAFINDVKADLHDADSVYLCLDNHKEGDYSPYLMKSSDRGRTWSSMASDLPERHLVWRIVQDHLKPELFFLGTEFGIFATLDAGEHWLQMKGGLPTIPFRDLAIQKRENDLVGASFGRSFYVLDDYAPMRALNQAFVQEEMHILPVRDSLLYRPTDMLGGRHGSQGDSHYSSDNPEFGAVIRYYLRDGLKSLEAQRAELEKDLLKDGEDTPYPGWDALRAEQDEEDPALILEIHDARGNLVRRLDAPSGKGMQSVAWDLRHAGNATGAGGGGPMALAGTYHVTAVRMQDGVSVPWGNTQSITLSDLLHPELDHIDRAAAMAWQEEIGRRQNVVGGSLRVLDAALGDVVAMKDAVRGGRASDLDLGDRLRVMELELQAQRRAIAGDDLRSRHGHEGAPSIQSRLRGARWGGFGYANNPTTTMREQADLAWTEFEGLHGSLQVMLEVDVPAIKAEVDAAGVGWTSGRGLPALER